ncbi:hypothetical protein ACFQY7_21835 [Actinomadura luteofluorescens]|uniref:hypothetical protein n=1 Tax=Actinomadura luteofluorescens TaxID=46163 RepID=UPI0036296E34
MLVTSRNRLTGLEGATLLDLEVLSPPQAVDLLTRVIGPRRVAAEPEGAVEIVRLCGHIPLAVRIAAGRLAGRPNWTLAHLAEVLRDERGQLDELSVGDLAVRASFRMSYRPLPPATRRAFRMIGLLDAPDFTLWTVAALLGVPLNEARPHLERLIDAQLVNVVGTDATGGLRHRMHELIRLYARECAEAEDAPASAPPPSPGPSGPGCGSPRTRPSASPARPTPPCTGPRRAGPSPPPPPRACSPTRSSGSPPNCRR